MTPPPAPPLLVLIPVFNEWAAIELLLPRLDRVLAARGLSGEVVLIDDASTSAPAGTFRPAALSAAAPVGVLRLARNLGHQRAIAVGLAWAAEHRAGRRVVLMDGDGEDSPADVPRLLAAADADPAAMIVFAARTRRAERWTFQVGYRVYQVLHRVLTGHPVRVGNFSVISPAGVARLAVMSEMWNHYAAAAVHARVPHATVPTARAKRLEGRSRMNFTALVVHGLSAISVFGDRVGVRLFLASLGLAGLTAGATVAAILVRVCTDWAIPGWATTAVGLSANLTLTSLFLATVFALVTLGGRGAAGFIPIRDYRYFVGSHTPYPPPE